MKTQEGLLEPTGWIKHAEYDQSKTAWLVEVPAEAVTPDLREHAARCAEEAREVWGLPPVTVRWVRTTCNATVAQAQWERTRRYYQQTGVDWEPLLHNDRTDETGICVGTVTDALLEQSVAAGVPVIRHTKEQAAADLERGDHSPNTLYLVGESAAYNERFPLSTLVAHEVFHILQYVAAYPPHWHEPLAYYAAHRWYTLRTGYLRLDNTARERVHTMLREPVKASINHALDTMMQAAAAGSAKTAQHMATVKARQAHATARPPARPQHALTRRQRRAV